MSDWRLAMCLVKLFAEINTAHPNRPKGADGSIGDARHAATQSDHNPNADGVVTAIDITTADFTDDLAEDLRLMGKAGDGRVKYVIYKERICSERGDWKWRAYSGFSKHYDHIHLSCSSDPRQYDRTDPWQPKQAARDNVQPTPIEGDDVTPEDIEAVAQRVAELLKPAIKATEDRLHADHVVILRGTSTGSHPNNLTAIGKAVGVKQ